MLSQPRDVVGRLLALVAGALYFSYHDRVAHLDAYAAPITAVGYEDGAGTVVALPLRNAAAATSVTVHAVDPFPELLGMLEVDGVYGLPVRLGPGDEVVVGVRARFTNCAYYTERAVNRFAGADVEVATGGARRTVTLDYPAEVVLRSPTILGCGDRVTDRSARQRLLARDE
jgi:hypothetical protein